jgi:hypothetical protein
LIPTHSLVGGFVSAKSFREIHQLQALAMLGLDVGSDQAFAVGDARHEGSSRQPFAFARLRALGFSPRTLHTLHALHFFCHYTFFADV